MAATHIAQRIIVGQLPMLAYGVRPVRGWTTPVSTSDLNDAN
jgi:hypothetical protein